VASLTLYVPDELLARARAADVPLSRTFRYALVEVLAAADGAAPGTLAAQVLPLMLPEGEDRGA
jgi:hypothetical protein